MPGTSLASVHRQRQTQNLQPTASLMHSLEGKQLLLGLEGVGRTNRAIQRQVGVEQPQRRADGGAIGQPGAIIARVELSARPRSHQAKPGKGSRRVPRGGPQPQTTLFKGAGSAPALRSSVAPSS